MQKNVHKVVDMPKNLWYGYSTQCERKRVVKVNRDKFRGLVYSRYKSMQEFSEAIGWQRNKTARIMNGVQEPNSEEMRTIAELFHLSSEEFIDIFFENQFKM